MPYYTQVEEWIDGKRVLLRESDTWHLAHVVLFVQFFGHDAAMERPLKIRVYAM